MVNGRDWRDAIGEAELGCAGPGFGYKGGVFADAIDSRFALQKLFWLVFAGMFTIVLGFLLASNAYGLVMLMAATAWLLLIPYHAQLSVILAVTTFNSALIFPYFPGRPFLWEFAALLAWSGLVLVLFLRRYPPDTARFFRDNKWLFIGAAGYCTVLVITMFYRGVGLRILGSEMMGGRFYFQQVTCAIFPLLFLMVKMDERTLKRLYILQCLLTTTYLVSDFVFSLAGDKLFLLLNFFELPGDAINFEVQNMRFGIRRFQSLSVMSSGFFFLFLVLFNLDELLTMRGVILVPLFVGIVGLGLLSGHRYLVLVVTGVFFFAALAQRFFTTRNNVIGATVLILCLMFAYGFAERMPLSGQRALSMLPGINIDKHAKSDGDGTLETRRILRKIGMNMMPDYFWMGRGFGQSSTDYSWMWDPTTITTHVNQGRFYNGFIGLMVNTGVFGTAFMLIFLGGGTALALRVIHFLRRYGCHDAFARMSSVVAGLWMTSTIAFLFLHGDSEYAMKTFSLVAGLLIACHRLLVARREKEEDKTAELEPVAEANPAA